MYRACMKEAAAQGRSLIQRLVRRAVYEMPRRAAMQAGEAQRKFLLDATRTLAKHEGSLCEAYPQALLAEFALAISGDARRSGAMSFDSLELMGDEQMQENVDLLRLQQVVLAKVEADLAELNALVCAVQGLRTVQAERNPLRPEAYVRSLRTVTLQSPVPPAMRNCWMLHLGEAMAPELAAVYRDLGAMLRAQGVTPAGFVVTPSPPVPAARDASAPSDRLNVRELRSLLAGEFDEPAPVRAPVAAAHVEYSPTMPAAFEALQEMKQVDKVMRRMQQRGSPDDPRAAAQALGQEVVNLMVENIAGDARLLAPVQQAVRELLPALQRLVLVDPRFFSDRKHPARRLLDTMTQRSLAWQAAEEPGFQAFIDPLRQAVEALRITRTEGAEPFAFALESLEEAWGAEQERDQRFRERAVRALLRAEQRNLLAEKIAREMRARLDVPAAPREISAFITGPWSQVMAQARLADDTGAPDPGGFAALVPDLLWSVQPRLAASSVPRLARLVPQLVEKIGRGLALIDNPPASTQRFLAYLAATHDHAMQSAQQPERPVALSTSMTREELESMMGGDDDTGPGTWLGATEAEHSGFMPTHQSLAPRPLFKETQPGFTDTRPRDLPTLPSSALQPGTWVEMLMGGGWARFQVTWASPHGTLYMFGNGAGRSHSMTRRLIDRMLQGGTLRMVSGQAVVDRALDAVAQAALRNSLDIRL
nr:DUF1631 family protein [Caenimonas aquaedulcis]